MIALYNISKGIQNETLNYIYLFKEIFWLQWGSNESYKIHTTIDQTSFWKLTFLDKDFGVLVHGTGKLHADIGKLKSQNTFVK